MKLLKSHKLTEIKKKERRTFATLVSSLMGSQESFMQATCLCEPWRSPSPICWCLNPTNYLWWTSRLLASVTANVLLWQHKASRIANEHAASNCLQPRHRIRQPSLWSRPKINTNSCCAFRFNALFTLSDKNCLAASEDCAAASPLGSISGTNSLLLFYNDISQNDANSVLKFPSSQTFAFTPCYCVIMVLSSNTTTNQDKNRVQSSVQRPRNPIPAKISDRSRLCHANWKTTDLCFLTFPLKSQRRTSNLLPYQFSTDFVRKILHLPSFFFTSHLTTAFASKCTSDAAFSQTCWM